MYMRWKLAVGGVCVCLECEQKTPSFWRETWNEMWRKKFEAFNDNNNNTTHSQRVTFSPHHEKKKENENFPHFSFPSAFLYSSPILSFASEWGRKKISSSTPADSHKIAHTQLHEENNERKEKKLLAMKVMKRRLKIGMAAASIPEKKAIKYWSGDETKDVVEERLMAGVPTLGVKCVRQKTSRGTKSTSQHNISQRTKSSLKIQSNMRRVEVFIWK